ncbi:MULTISPECIES: hypothetical protein [unclassified Pseudarthrobacter]|uniref:hypothetical protein n=1 Tax=unclassified Pseudarthrobacter TaxID=2647000 RepID=UPI00307762A1
MTTSTTTTLTQISHFINGAETVGEGDRTQPVFNPATGAVSGELRLATVWWFRPSRADLDARTHPRLRRLLQLPLQLVPTVGPRKPPRD